MSTRPLQHGPIPGALGARASDPALELLQEQLLEQLRAFASGRGDASPALIAAISGFVRQLRAAGLQPEQALVAFKQLLQQVMPRKLVTDPLAVHDRTRQLVANCIEAYFDGR